MIGFIKKLLEALKPYLIKFLERAAIKAVLAAIIPNKIQEYFIKLVIKKILFDKFLTPKIKEIFLGLGFTFDVMDGKILIKRLQNAENQTEYDSIIDDIIG